MISRKIHFDNIVVFLLILAEIKKIKRACEITDECFEHLKNYIKIGKTEKEIAFEIEMFFKTHGADGLAFNTIVAIRRKFCKPTLDSI